MAAVLSLRKMQLVLVLRNQPKVQNQLKELNMRSQLNVPSMPDMPRLLNHYLGPDYLEISFLNNRGVLRVH